MIGFTETPVTRLVYDMAFEDYKIEGLNNSSLSWFDPMCGGAPAKWKFYMEHPEMRPAPGPALKDGSCYHAFCLNPESFDQYYTVRTKEIEDQLLAIAHVTQKGKKSEKFSTSLGVYKDWERQMEEDGKIIISQKRSDELHWMRDAVLANREVKAECVFNEATRMEVSAFSGYEFKRGDHAGKKLQIKARFDLVPPGDALFDLKTARTAHPQEFARQCFNLEYHRQAALYVDVANGNEVPIKRFGFIVQDKEPPYLSCIHWVNGWLDHGRLRYKNIFSGIADCITRNYWPGYSSGELEPPAYAMAELEAAA